MELSPTVGVRWGSGSAGIISQLIKLIEPKKVVGLRIVETAEIVGLVDLELCRWFGAEMDGAHGLDERDCSGVHDVVGVSEVVDVEGVVDVVGVVGMEYSDAVLDADLAVVDQHCLAAHGVLEVPADDQMTESDVKDSLVVLEGHGQWAGDGLLA